jgi:hypothetical protein
MLEYFFSVGSLSLCLWIRLRRFLVGWRHCFLWEDILALLFLGLVYAVIEVLQSLIGLTIYIFIEKLHPLIIFKFNAF